VGSALPADGMRPVTRADCTHDSTDGANARDMVAPGPSTAAAIRLVINRIAFLASLSEAICCGVLMSEKGSRFRRQDFEPHAAQWMSQLRKLSRLVSQSARARFRRATAGCLAEARRAKADRRASCETCPDWRAKCFRSIPDTWVTHAPTHEGLGMRHRRAAMCRDPMVRVHARLRPTDRRDASPWCRTSPLAISDVCRVHC
jgi:hypothetical protein